MIISLFNLEGVSMYLKMIVVGFATIALSHIGFASEDVSQTCEDFSIKANEVSAYCRDQAGDFVKTSIVIHGLENSNGQLKLGRTNNPANFHSSCEELLVDDYGLLCATCKMRDGSWMETSIDLGSFLSNKNGALVDKRFP